MLQNPTLDGGVKNLQLAIERVLESTKYSRTVMVMFQLLNKFHSPSSNLHMRYEALKRQNISEKRRKKQKKKIIIIIKRQKKKGKKSRLKGVFRFTSAHTRRPIKSQQLFPFLFFNYGSKPLHSYLGSGRGDGDMSLQCLLCLHAT